MRSPSPSASSSLTRRRFLAGTAGAAVATIANEAAGGRFFRRRQQPNYYQPQPQYAEEPSIETTELYAAQIEALRTQPLETVLRVYQTLTKTERTTREQEARWAAVITTLRTHRAEEIRKLVGTDQQVYALMHDGAFDNTQAIERGVLRSGQDGTMRLVDENEYLDAAADPRKIWHPGELGGQSKIWSANVPHIVPEAAQADCIRRVHTFLSKHCPLSHMQYQTLCDHHHIDQQNVGNCYFLAPLAALYPEFREVLLRQIKPEKGGWKVPFPLAHSGARSVFVREDDLQPQKVPAQTLWDSYQASYWGLMDAYLYENQRANAMRKKTENNRYKFGWSERKKNTELGKLIRAEHERWATVEDPSYDDQFNHINDLAEACINHGYEHGYRPVQAAKLYQIVEAAWTLHQFGRDDRGQINRRASHGGHANLAVDALLHGTQQIYRVGSHGVKDALKRHYNGQGILTLATVDGTYEAEDSYSAGDHSVLYNHAYTVGWVDRKKRQARILNPHNTRTQAFTLSFDECGDAFGSARGGCIDYDEFLTKRGGRSFANIA